MNKKDFIISFLFLSCLFSLSAQEESSRDLVSEEVEYGQPNQTYNTYKTTWKKNRFKDNWAISIGGGAQILMAIDDDKAPFKERITFAPQFTISKYFSPIWGLRLNFTGGSVHGFNDGNDGTYVKWNHGDKHYLGKGYAGRPGYPATVGTHFLTWDPQWYYMGFTIDNPDVSKRIILDNGVYKWVPGMNGALYMEEKRYFQANIDFMFDFFNLVGNYNPKRIFELTPFGGVGLYRVFAYRGGINMYLTGVHAGMIAKVRINDRLGAHAEFSGSMISDNFDGQVGDDQNVDIIAQTTLSLSYKLGRTDWEVAEPMDYELINRMNDEINSLRERNAKLASKECPTCPPPPPVVKTETKATSNDNGDIKFLPDPVFFRLNKSVIDPTEWIRIEKAAFYLKEHPDATVVVTGYADKETGNPTYNMKISERRAKTVAQALIEQYGVNPLRISINWSGDKIQPFKINNWNRVVIFVIE